MVNGEWEMGNGEWGMGNGEEISNGFFMDVRDKLFLDFPNRQSPVPNHQSPITSPYLVFSQWG